MLCHLYNKNAIFLVTLQLYVEMLSSHFTGYKTLRCVRVRKHQKCSFYRTNDVTSVHCLQKAALMLQRGNDVTAVHCLLNAAFLAVEKATEYSFNRVNDVRLAECPETLRCQPFRKLQKYRFNRINDVESVHCLQNADLYFNLDSASFSDCGIRLVKPTWSCNNFQNFIFKK